MKLYTKTICPKCLWVKSELKQANLTVEIINIDHEADGMNLIKAAGFTTVPVLENNGQWFAETAQIIEQIAALSK